MSFKLTATTQTANWFVVEPDGSTLSRFGQSAPAVCCLDDGEKYCALKIKLQQEGYIPNTVHEALIMESVEKLTILEIRY